jgi:hypothetical protein
MVVAVRSETVHTPGVAEANDTARFDVADADKVIRWPASAPSGGVKLIVCGIFPTGTDPVMESAGAYLASPGWDAVIAQVPALARVSLEPETVHTSVLPEA